MYEFNPDDWQDDKWESREKYIEYRLEQIDTFARELKNVQSRLADEINTLVPGISFDRRKNQTELQMKANCVLFSLR